MRSDNTPGVQAENPSALEPSQVKELEDALIEMIASTSPVPAAEFRELAVPAFGLQHHQISL